MYGYETHHDRSDVRYKDGLSTAALLHRGETTTNTYSLG